MKMDLNTAISLAGLIITLIVGAWKLRGMELSLSSKITEAKEEVEKKQDIEVKLTGDSLLALRQKISDVELYVANNYVRRDGFYKVKEELQSDFKALGDKLDARFLRLETKLDNYPNFIQQPSNTLR